MDEGKEPVADDELLYRRIPESRGLYDSGKELSPEAFAPHKTSDGTGISVYRAKYKPLPEAARGRAGRSYYVAILRAGDLKKHGIDVMPRPEPGDPGHAELPSLNSSNRKSKETLEATRILVKLCIGCEGPFPAAAE